MIEFARRRRSRRGAAALVFVSAVIARRRPQVWRLAPTALPARRRSLLARLQLVPQGGEDFALLWTVGADPARARSCGNCGRNAGS
jgi:hypothetical protein